MTRPHTTVVAGDQALAVFRGGLTGPSAFDLLHQAGGRLLVQLAVGVGKSRWLTQIITEGMQCGEHDLIVVLVPRKDILAELVDNLPATLPRHVLTARPRQRCGTLDADWLQYEQAGCGFLGREQLCGVCPRRRGCPWLKQYGKNLRGVPLILATQQHLTLNPQFLLHLQHHARARHPLVLLDESDLLLRSAERVLRRQDLECFFDVLEALPGHLAQQIQEEEEGDSGSAVTDENSRWLDEVRRLTQANTTRLRAGRWEFPWVDAAWAVAVQRLGRQRHGRAFRFLAFDLHQLARSDVRSRERGAGDDLRCGVTPFLGSAFIIFSGSIAPDLARYRLDPDHRRPGLVSPFAGHRFEHPKTRWYNIRSTEGAARYFSHNASRILDFFAEKIARNIRAGKRTLLIARKCFRPLCQQHLTARLKELGVGPVRIVMGNWKRQSLNDVRTLPLLNYGVSGVNRFEDYDAAYCLTGYYVSAATVTETAQDIDASDDRVPLTIQVTGTPPRRQVHVELPAGQASILPRIAQGILDQKEGDVVVQAVGRVRPFTRPREVITFHLGQLPGVRYTLEFASLSQARSYFGVATARANKKDARAAEARRLRAKNWPLARIAAKVGVSISSVKRYVSDKTAHKHL